MAPLPTLAIVLAVGTWLTAAGSMSAADLIGALVLGALPVESILPLMYLSHVREIPTAELLRHVSLVFQDPFLLDDTVVANLRLARPDASDAEVEAAARAAQAHDFIVGELPHGYDTRVGERGARLSGGQRQRLTIARSLLADARIVVLDEATAFADPETKPPSRTRSPPSPEIARSSSSPTGCP